MRINLLVVVAVFCTSKISSQELVRVFGGINVTNIDKHRIIKDTGIDSAEIVPENYILPFLGVDVQIRISNKSKIVTGLGVDWMGAKNFGIGADGLYFKVDNNFKLGYLRIPLTYNLEVLSDLYVLGGGSINYNFRKTQGFFYLNPDGSSVSYYSPWHIGLLGGLRYDWKNLSLVLNYHYGLTRLYDSKELDADYHVYGELYGLQLSVGYLFEEK